jgi:predicted transcriptional regulator
MIMTTTSSQSPRDHIQWILAGNGGKMELRRLRRASGLRMALLNPILDELMKEGRISITGKDKNIIVLIGKGR